MSEDLIERLLDGDPRALARAITRIENQTDGYRDIVSALSPHAGSASVVGVTGSPGSGKSTLVDELAGSYRDRGETVGVIAVDPSSPYTGGAVLGDRIRMGSTSTDMGVFVRSMSARGQLGGLAAATADAVTALDAFGMDRIVIETVGAGQNEVDIVRTADTVAVLVQPGSGDDVQMLKAGILEIGDVFAVNKADMSGSARTVAELKEMIESREESRRVDASHHGIEPPTVTGSGTGAGTGKADATPASDADPDAGWTPPVVETVATEGRGIDEFVTALDDHYEHLERTGKLRERSLARTTAEIRRLLRADAGRLIEDGVDRDIDALAASVVDGETDPYTVVDGLLDPLGECLDEVRSGDE